MWGSHVYFEATKAAYAEHGIAERPLSLTRDNGPNWRSPEPAEQTRKGAGSPAHHRYPVWWTGDGVPLMASVESMVEEVVRRSSAPTLPRPHRSAPSYEASQPAPGLHASPPPWPGA